MEDFVVGIKILCCKRRGHFIPEFRYLLPYHTALLLPLPLGPDTSASGVMSLAVNFVTVKPQFIIFIGEPEKERWIQENSSLNRISELLGFWTLSIRRHVSETGSVSVLT
jgi:hypothetical protein